MRRPIAHWPLNGHADDMIGGNNGSWTGTEKYAFNVLGKIMSSFNGSSYIPTVDCCDVTTGSFSIAFTIDGTITSGRIIAKKDSGDASSDPGYMIYVSSATLIVLNINDGANRSYFAYTLPKALQTGRPLRIVFVANRDAGLYYGYCQGGNASSSVGAEHNLSTIGSLTNAKTLTIGAESDAGTPLANGGNLRDVMFWNVALSADEAAQDFAMSLTPSHLWEPALPIPQSSPMYATAGSWLFTDGGLLDVSGNAHPMTVTGATPLADNRRRLDGTDDKLTIGNVGNILGISILVKPTTTTEELIKLATGATIKLVSGTVTYTGITASATYVDNSATTTMIAGKWQRLTCVFASIASASLEIGYDGSGYGAMDVAEISVFASAPTAAMHKQIYRAGVPAAREGELIRTLDGETDLSAHGRTITRSNCVSLPDRMTFANGGLSWSAITGIQSYGYTYIDPTTGIPSHYATDGVTTWTNGIATGAMPFAVGSTGFSGVTADIVDLWATSGSITAEQATQRYEETKVLL